MKPKYKTLCGVIVVIALTVVAGLLISFVAESRPNRFELQHAKDKAEQRRQCELAFTEDDDIERCVSHVEW